MAPPLEKVGSNYIPEDISFSILSKLSIKSLNRFTCVRKSWNQLFENPNFMNLFRNNLVFKSHSLYDENDVCLVLNQFAAPEFYLNWYLLSGDRFENKVKLNFPSPFPDVQDGASLDCILGSAINGTLCIYAYDDPTNVVLWNPATEEIKVIPPNLPEFSREVMIDCTLHGFGYDHVRDDYKVIQRVAFTVFDECTLDDDDDDDAAADDDDDSFWFWEIYSLKSNSWRKLSFDMPMRFPSANDDVYFNGMCHWLGKTFDETYVVSFNLGNDRFFLTPLPFEYTPFCFNVSLIVLNGFVTMISNHKETKSFHISILGEFGVKESWVRLFDIGPLSCIERLIGPGKNDNIFFKNKEDELVCLNLTTGMIEKIEKIDIKEDRCWCKVITYKKNLHPIGGINK